MKNSEKFPQPFPSTTKDIPGELLTIIGNGSTLGDSPLWKQPVEPKPDPFYTSYHTLLMECYDLLNKKGQDYSTVNDRFANFRYPGVPARTVLGIMMHKHYCAIQNFISKGKVESEPIRERVKDMINYLLLLNYLIESGE